jgi:RNA polymerase primary sigma factor
MSALNKYLNEIKDIEPLSYDEERVYLKRAKKGDQAAFDKLVTSNLRFVVKVAKNYEGQGLPLEDLISEGNFGLIKSVERFDMNKKVKLISYAV